MKPTQQHRPKVDVIGAIYLDHIRKVGLSQDPVSTHGGVGRNVAEQLAYLDIDVRLIASSDLSPVNTDIVKRLQKAGGDVRLIRSAKGLGRFYVELDEYGEIRTAQVKHPDTEAMSWARIAPNLRQRVDFVVIETGLNADLLEHLSLTVHNKGGHLCALPTRLDVFLPDPSILKRLALLILNRTEAEQLAGHALGDVAESLAYARTLCQSGVGITIITLGNQGVVVATVGKSWYRAALDTPVTNVIGAGDSLAAGVIAGLAGQKSLHRAVEYGVQQAMRTLACNQAVEQSPNQTGSARDNPT